MALYALYAQAQRRDSGLSTVIVRELLQTAMMCLLAPVLSSQIHAKHPDQIPIMAWQYLQSK